MDSTNQSLKPLTTKINEVGNIEIGGCDLVELAEKYGTPLYVLDEDTLKNICRDYKEAFKGYPKVNMMYASKGFVPWLHLQLLQTKVLDLMLFLLEKFIQFIRLELI